MPEKLKTTGFMLMLIPGALGLFDSVGCGAAVLMVIGLTWMWLQRARLAGQGAATSLCAGGMACLGLARFHSSTAAGVMEADLELARFFAAASMANLAFGLALITVGAAALAAAKGRTRWWGLMGLLNVVGFGVVAILPVPPPKDALGDSEPRVE